MSIHVAVITGASSGIGRATALRFAEAGWHVALAARDLNALNETAEACRAHGVNALCVKTDVTKPSQVKRLAESTVDRFGAFDVWVNNAAVTAMGSFSELSTDVYHQVMETNFFGYIHGAREALRQFRLQGRGTLINVASIFGVVSAPYESPYIASKHAIRGWSGSLREELQLAGEDQLHVCTVLPAAIDTPIYRNAANYTGQEVVPPPPLFAPEKVAAAIFNLTERPEAETTVGSAGQAIDLSRRLTPVALFEHLFGRYIRHAHFTDSHAPRTDGNLTQPSRVHAVSGHWSHTVMQPSKKRYLFAGALAGGLLLAFVTRNLRKGTES